ncbi:ABC transporter ATP-binding protein [candidate division KSB3 bacterium]|uniref:ABC transporter ATP-binding protein n=1 Tax=candidate division KSB3 bacterium TaxID=2044937 RepID=A0A2G6E8W6_9BACT|nr:MAG: ABC transporter ATP-binding protein [candidate division KSB3 bacterium]PIE29017.1 MAG: ABC transporter ATP-binding protein [candidate division KSB3 bacterium]
MLRCTVENISLERNHDFKLCIPSLEVCTKGHNAITKLPLMGKSGAGKSTLLNLMAAVEWPDTGGISWEFPDRDAPITWSKNGPSPAQVRLLRRRYFGFAFQDSTLLTHMSVRENLSYPLILNGLPPCQAYEAAWNALDRVLLDDERSYKNELFRQFPSKLSGGQRQRTALVQAMIHNPCVLFADEPTGSLDRATRKQVMQSLYNWVDDQRYCGKRLLLWVTHHENDPCDAGAQWILKVDSGSHTLLPFNCHETQ